MQWYLVPDIFSFPPHLLDTIVFGTHKNVLKYGFGLAFNKDDKHIMDCIDHAIKIQ